MADMSCVITAQLLCSQMLTSDSSTYIRPSLPPCLLSQDEVTHSERCLNGQDPHTNKGNISQVRLHVSTGDHLYCMTACLIMSSNIISTYILY